MLQLVDQPTEHGELDEFSYDNAPPKAAKGTPTNRQTLLDGKLWHLTPELSGSSNRAAIGLSA